MFHRLFRRRPPPAVPLATVPSGSRVYAVGDVHGCVELLRRLHILIEADGAHHPGRRKVIVYLGDYIDRGPESRAVIDLLLKSPLTGFEPVYLKGNHEDALLKFLEDEDIGPAWLTYGGGATLCSYGVRPPDSPTGPSALQRAQTEIVANLPSDHLDFLNRLALIHTEGDYVFVHAGLRPNVPTDRQSAEDLMWIRDEFLLSDVDFGKIVVHGHSIAPAPEIRHNRIGIDTGAFASGRLTCLVLDGADRLILST